MFMCVQARVSCKWANESQRLILLNFDAIRDSPTNIYHDAVPFSPSSSSLHKWYTAASLQTVEVVKGRPDKWGTCSRVVSFDHFPEVLACHKNIVAVGLSSGDIITLDAITGTRRSVFSGHTDDVTSLVFSLDGALLASGSKDSTVKLWDIQTGGIIKTFRSDTHRPCSVSISPDSIMVASGSHNNAICLWDIRTGKCHRVVEQCFAGQEGHAVTCVKFVPAMPRHLLVTSEAGFIQSFNIDGSKIGFRASGAHVAFSSDGSHFVSSGGKSVEVRDSCFESLVTTLPSVFRRMDRYCLSPSGKVVVGVSNTTAHVWDTTNPTTDPVKTFAPHDSNISSLVFSSCLISASSDKSVRFWQVGGSSPNQITMETRPEASPLIGVTSIILQAEERTVISINSSGIVGLWDLVTGLRQISFQAFATDFGADGGYASDARLVGGLLTVAFCGRDSRNTWKITTWDVEKEDYLQTVALPLGIRIQGRDLRISGDGTMVFGLDTRCIQIWSTSTGRSTGVISFAQELQSHSPSFIVDGSRVWIRSENSPAQGWDLRNPQAPPLPLSEMPSDGRRLGFIQVDGTNGSDTGPTRIEDAITRREVFRLPKKFAQPSVVQWDGRYLATAYNGTGELLIMDFIHMIPQ